MRPDPVLPGRAVLRLYTLFYTEYGVPHIYAHDLQAMGFGLAWVELEDQGLR